MQIFKANEGFLVRTENGMLPGHYEDERAAQYATTFSTEELQELAKDLTFNAITYEMLQKKADERDK